MVLHLGGQFGIDRQGQGVPGGVLGVRKVAKPVPQIGENGYSVERAVTYPEFVVDRVRLEATRSAGQDTGGGYRLLFVVEGMGQLTLPGGSSHTLVKQDALILPATMGPFEVAAGASGPLVYLDARPNPEGAEDSAD